jgi:hypothetical protein
MYRRFLALLRRVSIAVALSLPGIALAMAAKPLLLGDTVLLLGVLLAFALPVYWLVTPPAKNPAASDITDANQTARR